MRGGAGEEYESSIEKGGQFLEFIYDKLYPRWEPVDIFIDRNDVWHIRGMPVMPSDLAHRIDVAWNYSHPAFSQILNSFSIPHVSPPTFSSTISGERKMLEEHMRGIGVNMPRSLVFPIYQQDFDGPREEYAIKKAREVFEKFSPPWVVRSFAPNVNMAVHVTKTLDQLAGAIFEGVKNKTSILVEELIDGKVTAVHSVPGFRGESVYIFPSPNFSAVENKKLGDFSKLLHEHLGDCNYLKSDIILHPKRGIYLLGLNFSPNLKSESHFDQSAQNVGARMHHVIEHILARTLNSK